MSMFGAWSSRGHSATFIARAILAAALVVVVAGTLPAADAARLAPATGAISVSVSPMTEISGACTGGSAEVEEATAAPHYVYAEWIGCGGIGFARSVNGGKTWSKAFRVPGSAGFSWDPAIAIAPDGTIYAAYMIRTTVGKSFYMSPQVTVSHNHGVSFTAVYKDIPPVKNNWGDRDFIAVGPNGHVYLTWDYGPSAAEVKLLCDPSGSCAYSNGDFNAVVQTSVNGGKTWGPITHLEPGFPIGGGYGAPLVVRPGGGLDVLYIGHPTDPGTLAVHPGWEYFTSSKDTVHWPAHPLKLWPGNGTLSLPEWWIDGDIGIDNGGNLYVTWDTQTKAGDIGWLTWSADNGKTWSRPLRVPSLAERADTDNAPHIVQVIGAGNGKAYVAWQTSAPKQGYATYLRPFSIGIRGGWLGPAVQVSSSYGKASIWPGDTFGIALQPGNQVSLTWGSATGTSKVSQIYASIVTYRP
jgi:hypothetical protein